MCEVVPRQVVLIEEGYVVLEVEGQQKEVGKSNFFLDLENLEIGDWVIMSAGRVIKKISPVDAQELLALIREIEIQEDEILKVQEASFVQRHNNSFIMTIN